MQRWYDLAALTCSRLFLSCSWLTQCLAHDLVVETCSWLVHAFFLTYSWLAHDLFTIHDLAVLTSPWLVQNSFLFITCSRLAHDLFTKCLWIINDLSFAHDLFINCSFFFHDLPMSCSQLVQNFSGLIHNKPELGTAQPLLVFNVFSCIQFIIIPKWWIFWQYIWKFLNPITKREIDQKYFTYN